MTNKSSDKPPHTGKLHATSGSDDTLADVARTSQERALLAMYRKLPIEERSTLVQYFRVRVESTRRSAHLCLIPGGHAQ